MHPALRDLCHQRLGSPGLLGKRCGATHSIKSPDRSGNSHWGRGRMTIPRALNRPTSITQTLNRPVPHLKAWPARQALIPCKGVTRSRPAVVPPRCCVNLPSGATVVLPETR
jgi:hypothetical protein